MILKNRATVIGTTAIILWGTLALLTRFTGAQLPPFQLMAMTFSLPFSSCFHASFITVIGE